MGTFLRGGGCGARIIPRLARILVLSMDAARWGTARLTVAVRGMRMRMEVVAADVMATWCGGVVIAKLLVRN